MANQLRLFLHAGADWLIWTLRAALPKRSPWRRARFDTLRLTLVKIAARIVEMKTRIAIHLPSACPVAPLMRLPLGRLPRMAPIRHPLRSTPPLTPKPKPQTPASRIAPPPRA